MTTHADLVARLRELADAPGWQHEDELLQLGDYPGGIGQDDFIPCHDERRDVRDVLREIADALAALPPPADPPRINTPCPSCGNATLFIGSGGHLTCSWLKCPDPSVESMCERILIRAEQAEAALTSRPADPPALVALVREIQDSYDKSGPRFARALDDLLAYPLPAVPPVTDTPQPGEMPPSSTWGDIGPQTKGWPDGNNPVRWNPKPDCVIGVYCQRHGFIHGQEAEELRERLEELGNTAVNRVLDEVDARDSLAYLEATNEPTPPDAAPPQEDQ